MRSHQHRVGAEKNRNGKSAKEKNQWRFDRWPQKKLLRGYRGSVDGSPDVPSSTLADVWPEKNEK